MSNQYWPATYKQRLFIESLEERLGETPSETRQMTVSEASERIGYLLQVKAAKELVDAVELPVDLKLR